MPRLSLFLLFFIFSTVVVAQTKLAGYVVEINSGKQKVSGYIIRSVGANTITTENNGQFMLVFANAQPGNPVIIAAQKEGWQVVNPKELNTILPKKADETPIKITVCKAGYLEKAKKEYYDITDSYITKEYEKRLKALNRQKEGWQKEAAELEEKLQLLNKQISEMADEYSLTNLDDLNETERKAVELFKAGDIDSSIKVRESLHSGEKIKIAIATKKQLDSVIVANENNLKQLANSYILKYDFEKAEKTYEELALADTSNFDNVFAFSSFLQNQNKHDKAIEWYQMCFRIATQLVKTNPTINKHNLANTQNNLGLLYEDKNNFTAAETAYFQALETYKILSKTNPVTYEREVAMIKNNLGKLYTTKNNFSAAETAYHEALEIYKRLALANSKVYEIYVATTENNLGVLYKYENNYTSAEQAYLKALEIRKRLAKTTPTIFEPDLASTLNNLGALYSDKNNFPAAESAFIEALEIFKRLAISNPATYKPDLARTQNNLGVLYRSKKNLPSAESAYRQALEIYNQLARNNPETYEPDVAMTQSNFGVLYWQNNDFQAAESAYRQALEIYKKLAIANPSTYEPDVARSHSNFGILYSDNNNYLAAEIAFLKAIEIYKRLAIINLSTYEPDVAWSQKNIGILYKRMKNYPAAESAYLEAYDIYIKYVASESEVYNLELCETIILIGFLQKSDYKQIRQGFIDSNFLLAKSILSDNKDVPENKRNLNDIEVLQKNFQVHKKIIRINQLEQKVSATIINVVKINITLDIIKEYKSLIDSGYSKIADELGRSYGSLAWYQLFEKQFTDAEHSAIEALNPKTFKKNEGYDSVMVWVNTNLALALLYQGKYFEAEKIYQAFKDKPLGNASYKETFLSDLDELEKAGITHKDVEKIRTLLK